MRDDHRGVSHVDDGRIRVCGGGNVAMEDGDENRVGSLVGKRMIARDKKRPGRKRDAARSGLAVAPVDRGGVVRYHVCPIGVGESADDDISRRRPLDRRDRPDVRHHDSVRGHVHRETRADRVAINLNDGLGDVVVTGGCVGMDVRRGHLEDSASRRWLTAKPPAVDRRCVGSAPRV